MNTEIINNPELPFAVFCIIVSFICGRISIVFARGGVKDHDFFSLAIGLIANLSWFSSVTWFWFEGNWMILVVTILLSLFGFNMIVRPSSLLLWKFRNLIRIIAICCVVGSWQSYLW
ncbi:hypothetical protein N8128_06805 [Paracoccaceae bacterium]|nr:hypothetical protein [Paracoccaceae bacterium]